MMRRLIVFALLSVSTLSLGQNVGIGTNTPDASAKLEVSSSNSGVLIPRISLTSITDVTTITSPATSLLVYNTNASITNGKGEGYYYWDGAKWLFIENNSSKHTVGDVKHGFQAGDHEGWVKLDGRLISSLSANQQSAATSLGFVTNLPDALNRVLKQKSALNATGGTNTVTITQNNLPNTSFVGATSSNGAHSHSGSTSSSGVHTHSFRDYGYSTAGTGGATLRDGTSSDVTMDENDVHNSYAAGSHTHSVSINSAGSHSHTVIVSSGGNDTPLDVENAYLTTNVFIYLGE